MPCPSIDTLQAWASPRVLKNRHQITEHVANCRKCSQRLVDWQLPLSQRAAVTTQDTGSFPDSADALTGQTLGKYEIFEQVGRGSAGIVYRGQHSTTGRIVAIKVLAPKHATTVNLRHWQRESRLVARISHPHVIQILDADRTEAFEYIVFEWLGGGSLSNRINRSPLQPQMIATLLEQIASGCEALHSHNILHLDIKPNNILLDDQLNAKLADFGISRSMSETISEETTQIVGTPGFMSPEQEGLVKGAINVTSDVYGIGAVLYAMLTGVHVPLRSTDSQTTRQADKHPFPNLDGKTPQADGLEAICRKCLELAPSARYQSAGEIAAAARCILETTAWAPNSGPAEGPTPSKHYGLKLALLVAIPCSLLILANMMPSSVPPAQLVGQPSNALPAGHTAPPMPPAQSPTELTMTTPASSLAIQQERVRRRISELGGSLAREYADELVLYLNDSQVTDEDLKSLSVFPELTVAFLQNTQVSIEGLMSLPPKVNHLSLGQTDLSEADFARLATRQKIEVIFLTGSQIDDRKVAALCQFGQLAEITLQGTSLTDQAIDSLMRCRSLSGLVLNNNTALSAAALSRLAELPLLQYLHLGGTGVDESTLSAIVEKCDLIEIGLSGCTGINDNALAKLENCESLHTLFLDSCRISDAGILSLSALPELTRIYVRDNKDLDFAKLREKLPPDIQLISKW
ncbi:protein kinase domain-containing protein [Aureliella helgolandensis]|nr:protein kinase [Aureliella helgolandensis]